ncbi:MAG TPA: MerR family transcriptional regulator [Myxococcaceae bacterium]|nr:MerR family transcriptional regulator [Myxococcaceae bacterium]
MESRTKREWKLAELADACGVSARTVRYYVQRGLLPAPVFKGRDTVYGEEHRARLLAIKSLQEKYLPLDAIEVELKRRTPDELAELARGTTSASAAAPIVPQRPPATISPTFRASPRAGTTYERVELAPGLEMHLSDDADPDVRQLAERIRRLSRRTSGGSQ